MYTFLMPKKDKVAVVVIPTYNEAATIGEMIDYLFANTFPSIKDWQMKLLIVDDTSPDGTYKVVQQKQGKLKDLHLSLSKEKARIGIIGLGAGTLASYFSQKNHSVYAYEIDPQVHEAAKKYFSLPSADNLRVHIGDARESLSKYLAIKYTTKFDVLLVDAFASKYSIPAHLVTKEAFNVYSPAISKNGIIAINIISAQSSPKSLVFRSISSTMRATFPYQVARASPASLPNGVQNIVLIGSAQPFPAPFISSLEKNNPVLQSWGQGEIFTDERSFVDYAMMEVLQ